jgi:hypothetical protein
MKTYTYPSGLVIRENLSEMVEQFKVTAPAKMQKVVKKNAFVIQAEAARDAPVDTGTLKNSISAEEAKDPNKWEITDGVEYGVFQELGTSKGVTAKHFLGGAAERRADPFFDELKEALVP